MTALELASMIDHTLLKPDTLNSQVKSLCLEAKEYNFKTVCVLPHHVNPAYNFLRNSDVKVCTVIGFPLGATFTSAKLYEAEEAINTGASELDMVMNISALKSEEFSFVSDEVEAMVQLAHLNGAILKVIIETSLLRDNEKVKATEIVCKTGADYIKTSTGFANGGARVEDVRLLRSRCKSSMKIKASGGVRDLNQTLNMIAAGASRIGTSSGVKIMRELIEAESY